MTIKNEGVTMTSDKCQEKMKQGVVIEWLEVRAVSDSPCRVAGLRVAKDECDSA